MTPNGFTSAEILLLINREPIASEKQDPTVKMLCVNAIRVSECDRMSSVLKSAIIMFPQTFENLQLFEVL